VSPVSNQPAFRAILGCPKPVVAEIDGVCVAGGTLLAAAADIAIATRRSRFGIPEARVGLADGISCALLPPLIGLARTRYLTLTGATIDAATAEAWGLVVRVVEDGDALAAAVAGVTAELRRASPSARTLYKRELNRGVEVPSAQMLIESATGPDGREGLSAFVEKRDPQWRSTASTVASSAGAELAGAPEVPATSGIPRTSRRWSRSSRPTTRPTSPVRCSSSTARRSPA
jgi:enoyl-CoA hydratase/carnithine racemase